MPNFTREADIWGFPVPPPKKKTKNAIIANFFRHAETKPLPDVGEIRGDYAGNRSTEVINIWCDSVGKLGIHRQKNDDGAFSLSSETTGTIEKIKGCKNVTNILYLHVKRFLCVPCSRWEKAHI